MGVISAIGDLPPPLHSCGLTPLRYFSIAYPRLYDNMRLPSPGVTAYALRLYVPGIYLQKFAAQPRSNVQKILTLVSVSEV